MSNYRKDTEELMDILLYSVSQNLLDKIQAGEATPQDISNAIKLLHNNGITVEVKKGDPLSILSEEVPFESDYISTTTTEQ